MSIQSAPALSVRQPWAGAILTLGKTIENRGWDTSHRSHLLIHASKGLELGAVPLVEDTADRAVPPFDNPKSGTAWATAALVGVVSLRATHHASDCRGKCSPWAMPDQWHWELTNPRTFDEPIPAVGRLKLWRPDYDARRALRKQLQKAVEL
ncbi:ASCH domain-containing protein [Nocardioides sp. R-C-SC26]|uniref:ASCH domain-containing protein n=1 Tax=Nocardioides sp. R-C-SC26 TaxID=2870414 RepID=UPI001E59AE8D|nr:ASCH domain-containing protein [Nocardioides sp. R-C-SC26]